MSFEDSQDDIEDLVDLSVLAADDNEINRKVIKCLLQVIGLDPVLVCDGSQALKAWRIGRQDMVLMDLQMPEMDGLAAARAIRAEEARDGLVPTSIIAVTADPDSYSLADLSACGIDAMVTKPIDMQALFEVMALVHRTSIRARSQDRDRSPSLPGRAARR